MSSVIRRLAQLRGLKDEWDALSVAFRSPLLDHDWFCSCAEAFAEDGALRVVTTRERGVLSGAAPLVREEGHGLTLLGASKLHEPSGWIYASRDAIGELAQTTVALGEPVVLQRLGVGSPLLESIAELTRGAALSAVRSTAPSNGIGTRGGWNEFCGRMSARTIGHLDRARTRAERELGRCEVRHIEPRAVDVDAVLEAFAAVEGSGWKGHRGSSLGQRRDLWTFFRGYCARAAERGHLRVTELRFGSRLAASEIAVDAYNRRWGLKIAYEKALAAHAPGLQLTHASIRAAFDRGLDAYEFLGSAEPWQNRWHPERRAYVVCALYPLSAAGLTGAFRDVTRVVWRRACRALQPPFWVAEAVQ